MIYRFTLCLVEIKNTGATSYTTDPYAIALTQTNSYLYPDMEYNLTDHLGSTRMMYKLNFTCAGVYQNATIQYLADYYSFGKIVREYINAGTTAEKYQYTGKERDTESGYDYFNARNYHSEVGRFLSVDPLAEKYPSISPYAYVANNPIMFIDPDGRDIVVPNKKDQAAVLKMINSKALGTYAFDKNGKLYQAQSTGDATKYSKYYADRLNAAIKDNQTIEIRIQQTRDKPTVVSNGSGGYKLQDNPGTSEDIDKTAGGGVTTTINGGNGDNVLVYISGNENKNLKDQSGNALEDKPADILAHELVGHAIPYTVGTDTGNAVDNENKVRKEVKTTGQTGASPLRKAEPTHNE